MMTASTPSSDPSPSSATTLPPPSPSSSRSTTTTNNNHNNNHNNNNNNNNNSGATVSQALRYLENVKKTFDDQPMMYQQFLDIMKSFKAAQIDADEVINRIKSLFSGHRSLILGFNQFLPPDRIIKEEDISDNNNNNNNTNILNNLSSPLSSSSAPNTIATPVNFNSAVIYVSKVKSRFQSQPEKYREFLNILHCYQQNRSDIDGVYQKMEQLFLHDNHLLQEFILFLPYCHGNDGQE